MLRRTFLSGLVLTAAAPALVTTEAEAAGAWEFLGERRVRPILDVDRINVGAGKGVFEKIKLKVRGNDLMILDLDVRYGNGANDDIPVRLLIPQGGETRTIDLRANNRFIRYVQFTYGKFVNGRGGTYVELWGRH